MTSTYQSFDFKDTDTIEERQSRLYLGMISCGEEAYTLGSAISEERKRIATLEEKLASIDRHCQEIKKEFYAIKSSRQSGR